MKKKDYIYIGIIWAIILVLIIVLAIQGKAYASVIDWSNQHYVLPEYFRNLFYDNGKLFPLFSMNLGMGQNIFYFSYYGFLSPIVLCSYILPFIPMCYYMIGASVFILFMSIFLFYKWVHGKYGSEIAFVAALVFGLNAPFSYHFHRHIMFVLYMPFMIWALKSVDLFFDKNKRIPLIFSTALMIFTSYYFSVYGIITIGVYTLYKLLSSKFDFKRLFDVVCSVCVSILIAGVLLLPTVYVLMNGRLETLTDSISLLSLINPLNNYQYTFYNSYYSWGLTFVYVLAVIRGFFSKNKGRIFVSTLMSLMILFPIVSYVFNVGMYIDGKCFFPFIPLAVLMVCEFLKDLKDGHIKIEKKYLVIVPVVIYLLVAGFKNANIYLLVVDIIACLIMLYFSIKKDNYKFICLPVIIVSVISFIISSCSETYITFKDLNGINDKTYYELLNIEDDGFYRVSNEDYVINNSNKIYDKDNNITTMYSSSTNGEYMNFIRNVFQNEIINRDNTTVTQTYNMLFNIYSGTKYIVSSNEHTLGYKLIKESDGVNLYLNESALPIMYASDKVMSKREFDSLSYPYTIDALLNYVIVNTDMEDVYVSNVKKYNKGYSVNNSESIKIDEVDGHYLIDATTKSKLNVKLNEKINDKVVIVRFNMNKAKNGYACSSDITINGIKNALSCKTWKYNNKNTTFEYVFAEKSIEEFNITFNNSSYDISDVEIYTIDYNDVNKIKDNVTEVKLVKQNDNYFEGNIEVKNDSYLKITIPYDQGFRIFVDDKESQIEMIDNAFMGVKLNSGNHKIIIKFTPPYLKEGIIFTVIGLLLLMLMFIKDKKILKK